MHRVGEVLLGWIALTSLTACATTTDAISGAWHVLRPGMVEVRFD